jgi:hypothetical protein
MEDKSTSLLVDRLRKAEARLRIFLALRAGLTASFYALCAIMLLMLMGVRVAQGEHTAVSYFVFWVTGIFAGEGSAVGFLQAFHPADFVYLFAIALGVAFAATALVRMLRRIPLKTVALYLDAKTGSKEQFSTAYELAVSSVTAPVDSYLVRKAAERMESERLDRKPVFLPPREAWLQAVPIAVLAGLLFWLNPFHLPAPPPPPPTQNGLSEEEKQTVDEVAKAIQKRMEKEKDPQRKEELKRIKEEIEKMKDEQLSEKEKMAKMNELMERLKKIPFESARDKAAETLKENKNTEQLGEALREGNDAKAEDALEKIGDKMESGELSQAEQEEVLKNLQKAKQSAAENAVVKDKLDRYLNRLSRMEKSDSLEEMKKQRDLEEMAKALKERNDEMYRKEAQKLLDKMEKGQMTKEDIESMRKALQQAADKMGDERVKRGMEQLEKSLQETGDNAQTKKDLETLMRQAGHGLGDEEMKKMAEKMAKGELSKDEMKDAAQKLEKIGREHGDKDMADAAKRLEKKLEGVDTKQIEQDLKDLMKAMKESDEKGPAMGGESEQGGQGGDSGEWTQDDWKNVFEQMEGLSKPKSGEGKGGAGAGKGGEGSGAEGEGAASGGVGGEDSHERTNDARRITPGSTDPEVEGKTVDLQVDPELAKGETAGRVYVKGKLYPRGKAKAAYKEILGEMKQGVLDKVESENVPANYRNRVKEFFDTQK